MTDSTVLAEKAPLGILLWPVRAPKYAPNFTLAKVEVAGDVVTWTYQGGNVRHFRKGERVVVRMAR